jgi:hypothetical protein
MVILPEPFDKGIALAFFDKSMDTACGVKFTVGRDMTTSDGDGDDVDTDSGLISSVGRRKKLID